MRSRVLPCNTKTKVTPAKRTTPVAPPAATGSTPQAPIQKPGTPTATTSKPKATTTTPKTNTKATGTGAGAGKTTGTGTVTKPPVSTPPPPPALVVVDTVFRDQAGAQTSAPAIPAVASPDPTPLAVVTATDRVASHGTSTPAWKLALLALLAAAEAFLVVRLVRHRPGALSPIS